MNNSTIYNEPDTINKVLRFIKKTKEEDRDDDIQNIMTIGRGETTEIVYDKLRGRPSVTVTIEGKTVECLLDTGATLNVLGFQNINLNF